MQRTRIKVYNSKRSRQVTAYKKVRYDFLMANPICEVCGGMATEIHHVKGRMGELLINPDYFLAVCRKCHDNIESNPTWAKENGYSLSRLQNNN